MRFDLSTLRLRSAVAVALAAASLSLFATACAAESDETSQSEDDVKAKKAKAGETCANGVFGTPKISCASGLECVYPAGGTAPAGPQGSSSARTGICEVRAALGETCGNGVFGAPKIACASGLSCVYPAGGTAPKGPTGSSSALAGKCQAAATAE